MPKQPAMPIKVDIFMPVPYGAAPLNRLYNAISCLFLVLKTADSPAVRNNPVDNFIHRFFYHNNFAGQHLEGGVRPNFEGFNLVGI
jgi:hypothetical protein